MPFLQKPHGGGVAGIPQLKVLLLPVLFHYPLSHLVEEKQLHLGPGARMPKTALVSRKHKLGASKLIRC